jgi:nitroreductase
MLEILNTRRSVRAFKSDPIPEKDIRDILEAAMNAPSAGDERAWQFVILKEQAFREEYAKLNRNVPSIRQSPVAIVICGDTSREKYPGLYVYDCGAATENILLAIHAKGLGGFWGHVFPETVANNRMLLNLPEHIIPYSVVPFGTPLNGLPPAKTRYDESRIHLNGW